MSKKIHLLEPSFTGNEKKYLLLCLKSTWISTSGRLIEKFENKIKDFTKSKYAIACMNGTSALHISLKVCGVKKGDEVIAPTITFIAPINAIDYCNADPIFMDADDFHNIDVKKVMSFLNTKTYMKNNFCYNKVTNKRISAIVIVHVWGNLADLENLVQICRKKKIKIVEDASEALGSFYSSGKLKGKHAGTIGCIGCLSFNGNKIITTGAGGMILTNNKKYFDYLSDLKYFNRLKDKNDWHKGFGLNFKITDLQASLGLSQFNKIESFVNNKRNLLKEYEEKIDNPNVSLPRFKNHELPWFFDLKINTIKNKKILKEALTNGGIESREFYPALSLQKYLSKYRNSNLKYSESIFKKILWLPSSNGLSKKDVSYISSVINSAH